MFLTNKDMLDLVELRHDLHRHPEISGEEKETAGRIRAFLEQAKPDRLLADLGGHGVAAVYDSGKSGPAILIRSELDALPIHEKARPNTAPAPRARAIFAAMTAIRPF